MYHVKVLQSLLIEPGRNVLRLKRNILSKTVLGTMFETAWRVVLATAISGLGVYATAGQPVEKTTTARHRPVPRATVAPRAITSKTAIPDLAEQRLLEVYRLAANAKSREALEKVRSLVQDYPNFQLAQLVYGDMLSARIRPVDAVGDLPVDLQKQASPALASLRDESRLRVSAARDRPRAGAIPEQFLALSPNIRHVIAVDGAKSRLYLFENRQTGLLLIADFYTSIGKSGLEKSVEGDSRTPLGVYFITSTLDPKSLGDFYGAGALPINYPNVLDRKRGKTGTGIWLHGTPSTRFSRPPLDTNGCVVLANPDLIRIMQTVGITNGTPVVIATQLKWVTPESIRPAGKTFDEVLETWKSAKGSGNLDQLLGSYSSDFESYSRTLTDWRGVLKSEVDKLHGRKLQLKNVSVLRWTDTTETMIVTFDQTADDAPFGSTTRQYWSRQNGQWKIFFEGSTSRPQGRHSKSS